MKCTPATSIQAASPSPTRPDSPTWRASLPARPRTVARTSSGSPDVRPPACRQHAGRSRPPPRPRGRRRPPADRRSARCRRRSGRARGVKARAKNVESAGAPPRRRRFTSAMSAITSRPRLTAAIRSSAASTESWRDLGLVRAGPRSRGRASGARTRGLLAIAVGIDQHLGAGHRRVAPGKSRARTRIESTPSWPTPRAPASGRRSHAHRRWLLGRPERGSSCSRARPRPGPAPARATPRQILQASAMRRQSVDVPDTPSESKARSPVRAWWGSEMRMRGRAPRLPVSPARQPGAPWSGSPPSQSQHSCGNHRPVQGRA